MHSMSTVMKYLCSDPTCPVIDCTSEGWVNMCGHLSVLARGLLSQDHQRSKADCALKIFKAGI